LPTSSYAPHGKFNQELLVKAGILLAAEGPPISSKGKRVPLLRQKRTVIVRACRGDQELIAFWLWQVRSMEEANRWGKRCPQSSRRRIRIEISQGFFFRGR